MISVQGSLGFRLRSLIVARNSEIGHPLGRVDEPWMRLRQQIFHENPIITET
jgi:hypothetical protein